MYKDAIDTARESDNTKIVEDLLKFFVERKEKEFFAASLYTCYEYIRPDLVLEYAWRFGMYEFAMPYMIQLVSELKTRVETVHKKTEDREKKEEQQAKEKMNQPLDFVANDLDLMMPGSQLMLTGGAPMQGGGMFGTMSSGMNPMMPNQFGSQPGPYGSTYGKPF
jgi:clathrin heavy chain